MISKKDVQELYKNGNKINSVSCTLIWSLAKNKIDPRNIVISVPKKHIKKAVDRNYIKRRVKEIYKKNQTLFESVNIILIYTKSSLPEFNKLKEELLNLFQILNTRINEVN